MRESAGLVGGGGNGREGGRNPCTRPAASTPNSRPDTDFAELPGPFSVLLILAVVVWARFPILALIDDGTVLQLD